MYRMIKSDEEVEDIRYKAPRGPRTDSELEQVAEVVSRTLKQRRVQPTRENIVDAFRSMNEDYDDWWARGLRTREAEDKFLKDITSRMKKYM